MFKDFYQLKTEPFSTHPNPGVIFLTETYKEAWYYLLFCIESQEPFVVLTGEYGMGKTLLCLRLVETLKNMEDPPVVEYIPTPYEDYSGIIRRIAFRLGISPVAGDVGILIDIIYDYLRSNIEHIRFYLIIDDAHELNISTLTKLKQLSTFSHNGVFPFIMIFVAHPSFLKDMNTPAISSLNQRVKRRYLLSRLNYDDTKNYIYFRLLKSGAAGIPVFHEDSLLKIFEYSGGVPRLINNICDTCLLIGASKKLNTISADVVNEARNCIESGLTNCEAKTETGVQPDSGYVTGTAVSISEDKLPVDLKASVSVLLNDPEAVHLNEPFPRASGSGKKVRKTAIFALLTILLVLFGAVLFRLFMNDVHIWSLLKFFGDTKEQTNTANHLSQDSVEAGKKLNLPKNIPVLREELIKNSSAEIAVDAALSNPTKPDLIDNQPQAADRMDIQPSSKTEGASLVSPEPNVYYPYSLRVSSYQNANLAYARISDIKQQGLSPYLVNVDYGNKNGIWWHIYLGQYSSEEEARKAKKDYKQPNLSVQKTEYTCQIGESSNETDMFNMFGKLKKFGYFPYAIQKGKNRFCLYIGAYKKKSNAEAFHQVLNNKGIISQVVRR